MSQHAGAPPPASHAWPGNLSSTGTVPNNEQKTESTLLLLPDGRLLIRNATPALISLLSGILPDHPDLLRRAAVSGGLPDS